MNIDSMHINTYIYTYIYIYIHTCIGPFPYEALIGGDFFFVRTYI
jgi:hypothetical protein